MRHLLLIIGLLYCSTPAFCQANWTYKVGFALNDRNGKPIGDYEVTSKKYRLFIGDASVEEFVEYVPALELFYVTSDAAYPGISIGMISGQDSIVVALPAGSERTILTNWPTEPGIYKLAIDATGKIVHPEALITYPTRFRQGDTRLFSVTVLDWRKYRVPHTLYDGSLKGFYRHELMMKTRE